MPKPPKKQPVVEADKTALIDPLAKLIDEFSDEIEPVHGDTPPDPETTDNGNENSNDPQ